MSVTKASYAKETSYVRSKVIDVILYKEQGLRSGLNHDIRGIEDDSQDTLVRHLLSKDKDYQQWRRKNKYKKCAIVGGRILRRERITGEVVRKLCDDHELERMNGIWTLKVSTSDAHRAEKRSGRHPKNRIKWDDRSYHGRPRRDRNRPLAA